MKPGIFATFREKLAGSSLSLTFGFFGLERLVSLKTIWEIFFRLWGDMLESLYSIPGIS